ncbi:hypothetical protein LTR78_008798 [Recurvomyces mirabilis]|uniref:Uncharacterized protein n=2 Tax=Recurvomyces mirabilis TaxID=574656 RepID=A0AAE0WIP1_9PEZI|nr:hypothetical protein LTR78_008798 [Recurvomyces mirabilis]
MDCDFCLDQAFSALDLTPEETINRRPSAQLLEAQTMHDDLLFQLAALLASRSAGDYGFHIATRPVLTWLRYNVPGALKAELAKNERSTESLIGVVALLTGWERAYGEAGAFSMHLQALRRIVKQSDRPLYDVQVPKKVAVMPPALDASHLPAGFAMLYTQRLLPAELISRCAAVASARVGDADMYDKLWRTSLITTGLGPSSDAAAEAFDGGHITAQIAKHVRLASLMCMTFLLISGRQERFHQPLMEGFEPALADTVHLPSDTLTGTIYDDVLLWSLCVFYLAAGRLPVRQLLAFRDLLHKFGIPVKTQSWLQLRDLMRLYLYNSAFDERLQWVMGLEEAANSSQGAKR